jgi:hypothetical protein
MPGATYAPQNRDHLCSLSHKVNCAAREGALGHKVNCAAREGALGHKVNCVAREGALGHSPRYEPLSPTGS